MESCVGYGRGDEGRRGCCGAAAGAAAAPWHIRPGKKAVSRRRGALLQQKQIHTKRICACQQSTLRARSPPRPQRTPAPKGAAKGALAGLSPEALEAVAKVDAAAKLLPAESELGVTFLAEGGFNQRAPDEPEHWRERVGRAGLGGLGWAGWAGGSGSCVVRVCLR